MKTAISRLPTACRTLMAIMSLSLGCGQEVPEEKGPSYADLVVIYTAELATLDRLEKKREDLTAKYKADLRPSPDRALELLGGVLNSVRDSEQPADPNEAVDPNTMLDQAVEDAQKAQDVADQLLDSFASDSVEDEERAEGLTEQFERELKALDQEIEVQKERVRRAREARDSAEVDQRM